MPEPTKPRKRTSKADRPQDHDWACIAHDGFPCDCGGPSVWRKPEPAPEKPAPIRILDTYDADLLNEGKPRRELVTELQFSDDGTGDACNLLCYANPSYADRIAECVGACAGMKKPTTDLKQVREALGAADISLTAAANDRALIQRVRAALRAMGG